jgi:putative Holliday junction resolvase
MKNRVLAIDFGLKRIGLALSDENKKIAFPLSVMAAGKTGKETLDILMKEILRLEKDRGCVLDPIVVGLPLHLSGEESPLSKEVRFFSERLKVLSGKEIILFDERMSSGRAHSLLRESGLNRKQQGDKVDPLAAAILLEEFIRATYGTD